MFHVEPLLEEIKAHPELWNQHTLRTAIYEHSNVSDIWCRYNAWENFNGDRQAFNAPHVSAWYPAAEVLTALKPMVLDLMKQVEGLELGGVLITKIPPHGEVKPHIDGGWHATYYDKFAIQLASSPDQAFCFEGESHSAKPGESYTFDNAYTHWVTNNSDIDRMTLIVCIRTRGSKSCPGAL